MRTSFPVACLYRVNWTIFAKCFNSFLSHSFFSFRLGEFDGFIGIINTNNRPAAIIFIYQVRSIHFVLVDKFLCFFTFHIVFLWLKWKISFLLRPALPARAFETGGQIERVI